MPSIAVRREGDAHRGAYKAVVPGGGRDAELTWTARGEARIANHTYVPPDLRGRGIATALVEALIADARAEGFKIDPQCSYVAAAFRRHPEWADLLAELPS
ncbi:GNAT family N-acetyltransferase [Altererythrobacter salegens]|uniref:GNAT family N-acetyltransferase n=1 Tax=Croceibacterium salegens TaxID=1737568 RepID=A0A6I4T1R3_9SPHN|nr:GNAT family N-acetyltransferase [Croceibacterium salegens]MXO60602.1 GNAT family N-acetyltransferase [Croceibacterium salegens]